jgi:hypothetical protein
MSKSVHPEFTAHLVGAPARRTWPLMPLIGVGLTSIIAAMAFIFMIISLT